uniref:Uncharacterized protein n=1 Tax=Pyramimonas orientalis virus TaxID=455367 RepID=A0A7M3UPF7_POV01|nr:hypothetical protein HWQ62_00515 [Pyramimonas orientalis virus]
MFVIFFDKIGYEKLNQYSETFPICKFCNLHYTFLCCIRRVMVVQIVSYVYCFSVKILYFVEDSLYGGVLGSLLIENLWIVRKLFQKKMTLTIKNPD